MKVKHFIRLKELAGTEIMFFNLVAAWSAEHNVILTSRIPRSLSGFLPPIKSWKRRKSVLGLRVPSKLQTLRDSYLGCSGELLVSWSQYKGSDIARGIRRAGGQVVHYDHGVSWSIGEDIAREWLSNVDRIVCVSQANKRVMQLRFGLDDMPIQVCFNPSRRYLIEDGGDVEGFIAKAALQPRVVIGMAGRLTPLKGMAIGIRALRQLVDSGFDVELHIAGTGSQQGELLREVEALGLEKRVKLLGHVADMASFYQSLSLFWNPTLRDPCPLVTLEALSYGVPVVGSRVDGLPEQISERENGFTIPCTQELKSRPWLQNVSGLLGYQVYDPELDQLRSPMAIDPVQLAEKSAGLLANVDLLQAFSQKALFESRRRFHFSRYCSEIIAALTKGS
ncbi:glycosyltransferase family 4 protein [Salinicola sp. RZ23]|uniref:glycosyltransferase family 4 protein n=1 Tax=Salinicola sp. RZ23 TaxID=1949087 RepID=UPI000DA15840|nr:glycosyltransferase family 4 protein [Salinicola sp. RZ23]